MKIEINDNSLSTYSIEDNWLPILSQYASATIPDLSVNHDDFFSIPLVDENQLNKKDILFFIENSRIHTTNIGGFIGLKNKEQEYLDIWIKSRFDSSEEQYFVKYMLSKILGIELLEELRARTSIGGNFDFLIFLFPKYLRLALSQGLFRTYRYIEYNNSTPKGRIDIQRNLAINTPFRGNIAYSFREYTQHNTLMLLIREVIQIIQFNYPFIYNNHSFKQDCLIIKDCSSEFGKYSKWHLIELNSRPITNPYFTEYESLRRLCIQILKNEEIEFNESSTDEIYGVIYDLSWVWEEYLNVILESSNEIKGKYNQSITHSQNRSRVNGISPFEEVNYKWYPDYYIEDKIVIDAKYKNYSNKEEDSKRDDYMQIISYMHILNAEKGVIVYPTISNEDKKKELKLNGSEDKILEIPLIIPQKCNNFKEFSAQIKDSEKKLLEHLLD